MNFPQNQTLVPGDAGLQGATADRSRKIKIWSDFLRISGGNAPGSKSYADQIIDTDRSKRYTIVLNLDDVVKHPVVGQSLITQIRDEPQHSIDLISEACRSILVNAPYGSDDFISRAKSIPHFQIVIDPGESNHLVLKKLTDLTSNNVRHLIRTSGIVVNMSRIKCKAELYTIKCKKCGYEMKQRPESTASGIKLVKTCPNSNPTDPCPRDPFFIVPDLCTYTDFQTLTLQEEQRTFSASLSRYLCGAVSPGCTAEITAIYMTSPAKNGTSTPYLQIVGIRALSEKDELDKIAGNFDTARYTQFANDPNLYDNIVKLMCPMIKGHDNIKMAMAAMLFGGTRKVLDSGLSLRGDINLLMIGDPGLGKSQLLKFASKVSPRGVFTSGKGASAAGLTAAVVRDSITGEFVLEGGALVLADGGVCAVDEFDKMREQDRVALHEAMEQQTISISKAGITTVLTTRTSVFAASNPVSGSFDDIKSVADQVDFQTTILSRFDLIFALRDNSTLEDDKNLATYILNSHQNMSNDSKMHDENFDFISSYISYARATCNPKLHTDAIEDLRDWYSKARKTAAERNSVKIPITVRQLEAVIRLSEAFAKMSLSREATIEHVNRAKELFQNATMQAIEQKQTIPTDAWTTAQIRNCILEIKRKMPLHARFNQRKLKRELIEEKFGEHIVNAAIVQMVTRKELKPTGNNTLARVQ